MHHLTSLDLEFKGQRYYIKERETYKTDKNFIYGSYPDNNCIVCNKLNPETEPI